MLDFDLILLLSLFLRRGRKQHKDHGSDPIVSVVKGTLDIIRHAPCIFRKETSNGGVCAFQTYPRETLKRKTDERRSAQQHEANALVEKAGRPVTEAV